MAKRMILMLLAVGLFVGAIAAVKTKQIKTAIKQNSSFRPPPEAVTTVVAKQEAWSDNISAIGTAVAVRGVTVSADLPGIVDKIAFESGQAVRQGAVLVELDVRQERAQLAAAEAQRDLTRLSLERQKGLSDQGIAPKADFDKAEAEEKQAVARVGEIKATIERKTIRAPFSGVLGIRQVNLGQYLEGGAAIVPLQALSPIYVNFSVPQQRLAELHTGEAVRVTAEAAGVSSDGKLTAVDSIVDAATRNVQAQATLANTDGKLKPGMFVQASVGVGKSQSVITLPASSISYAPYGDSVFIVENMKDPKSGESYKGVRQQFVKLGMGRGDQVAVLTGVKPGQEVVTSGVFKLRSGAAVQVNNKVQPGNNPAPKPEDS
jgi:membrane fusion protein (multidrug efflux system)